jgi:hypothetical protein
MGEGAKWRQEVAFEPSPRQPTVQQCSQMRHASPRPRPSALSPLPQPTVIHPFPVLFPPTVVSCISKQHAFVICCDTCIPSALLDEPPSPAPPLRLLANTAISASPLPFPHCLDLSALHKTRHVILPAAAVTRSYLLARSQPCPIIVQSLMSRLYSAVPSHRFGYANQAHRPLCPVRRRWTPRLLEHHCFWKVTFAIHCLFTSSPAQSPPRHNVHSDPFYATIQSVEYID